MGAATAMGNAISEALFDETNLEYSVNLYTSTVLAEFFH